MFMLFARLYPSIVHVASKRVYILLAKSTAYEIAEIPGRGEVIMTMIAIKTIALIFALIYFIN
jgi:hypothetical protein